METREVLVHLNVDVGADNSDEAAKRIALELVKAAARADDGTFERMVALVDPT